MSIYRGYRGKRIRPYNIYLLVTGSVLLAVAVAIFIFVPHARFLSLLFGGLGFAFLVCYFLGTIPPYSPFGSATRKIRIVLIAAFVIWLVSFIVAEFLILSHAQTSENSHGADYLIVLGAGLYGSTPSPSLKSRLDETLVYADENPETIIIVSGGQGKGENITEALAMHKYLVNYGVSSDRVIQEDMATSTLENIRYSFDMIDNHRENATNPKVAVLSNEYHLFRTKLIADREGHSIELVSADTPMLSLKLAYYAREYFALLKYFIFK